MADTGVDFILRTGDSVQTFTTAGGGGGDDFTVVLNGVTSGVIDETDTGAQMQTILEAMSNITAGDVTVTGAAGGPYVLTWAHNQILALEPDELFVNFSLSLDRP